MIEWIFYYFFVIVGILTIALILFLGLFVLYDTLLGGKI